MTTKNSPLRALKQQADMIAAMLKKAERGEKIVNDPVGKVAASRTKPSVTFAVAMDDKILQITMAWDKIRETSEHGISEYILKQMRESRETIQ